MHIGAHTYHDDIARIGGSGGDHVVHRQQHIGVLTYVSEVKVQLAHQRAECVRRLLELLAQALEIARAGMSETKKNNNNKPICK